MKFIKIIAFSFLLFIVQLAPAFSHALWIETNTVGKIGQAQDVKIYYGEYALNERDSVSKWYSNVKEFTIWLVAPGKEKVKLNPSAGANYFQTSFTPDKEGVYTLMIQHEAKELGGTTKYEFLSSATVSVGKNTTVDAASNLNSLKVISSDGKVYKINTPVILNTFHNNQPVVNKSVTVFSPQGWQKEFKTNEKGIVEFTPIWHGRYLVEISNFEKTEGVHEGNSYKAIWKGATYSLEVK